MNKKRLIIWTCVILLLTVTAAILYKKQISHTFNNYILTNSSTELFKCEEFGYSDELERFITSYDPELIEIKNHLKDDQNIFISKAPYCKDKYQIQITFGSDKERKETENILKDQKIGKYPVFLQNV